MTYPISKFSSACVWIALASASCVLGPAELDGGLTDGEAETDTTGDGDGDGDQTGDGDGAPELPEPFECTSASALDGSPAQLPASACTIVCDDDFVGGQALELEWSLDSGAEGAFVTALLDEGPASSRLLAVERRHEQAARIRWFDEDGVITQSVELPGVGDVYDAVRDEQGYVYVVHPSDKGGPNLAIAVAELETGAIVSTLEVNDQLYPAIAGAADGFALLTHFPGSESTLWRYVHDGFEPVWTEQLTFADGDGVLGVSADGSIAIAGPETVAFHAGAGALVDQFDQGVDKQRVYDLVLHSPTSFVEVAFGFEADTTDRTEALVTVQNLDGSFFTRHYRWGDVDCNGELVDIEERLLAVALLDGGGVVAVGYEHYGVSPGAVTVPRIIELSAAGEIIGGARLAQPDALATRVLGAGDSFYVAVQTGVAETAQYQIRKYARASP